MAAALRRLAALALLLGCTTWSGCAGRTDGAPAQDGADGSAAPAAVDPARSIEYPKWETTAPGEYLAYNQRTNLLRRGHLVYQRYCVGCHGEYGDGKGPAAARLITQPRDFTSGIYKFRSTDSGSLPLEEDLYRTITRGLPRVSMPGFPLMPEREKVAVVEYIKTFYPDWEDDKADRRIVPVPRPPEDLFASARLQRGQVTYLQMGCWKCHGVDGRGTGATQTEYVDAWGNQQKPFDFTRGELKGGSGPEDIYRTFHAGLRSIMPSYQGETLAAVTADGIDAATEELIGGISDQMRTALADFPEDGTRLYGELTEGDRLRLAERNSWDLVAYILSLRTSTSTAEAVLGPTRTGD